MTRSPDIHYVGMAISHAMTRPVERHCHESEGFGRISSVSSEKMQHNSHPRNAALKSLTEDDKSGCSELNIIAHFRLSEPRRSSGLSCRITFSNEL
jgi:hypothetical protein